MPSSAATSSRRSAGATSVRRASGSATMSPTRMRGFSEEKGSWKTSWTCRARWRRADRPRPPTTVSPIAIVPAATGARPMTARATVDLPDPDSPTRPSTRPGSIDRLTSSTAVWACRPWPYTTVRSRTSRAVPGPSTLT